MNLDVIEKGDILIENGKIKEIKADISSCESCDIIDASGKMVFPGFIDAHCHIGMWEEGIGFEGDDGNEMTDPITPQLRAIDAINPMDEAFENAIKGGVTTAATGPGSANVIGGTFTVLKLHGKRVDDMVMVENLAMKCAFGENPKRVYAEKKAMPTTRMGTAAKLRETLAMAAEYNQKKEAAKEDSSKMPGYDMKLEAMIPVIKGEIPLKAHAHRADDIFTSIRIAKEFNVKLTLEHCTEGHLIADDLAKEGYPAIVGPTFGNKSKFELQNKTFDTPKTLVEAGVKIAIMTDSPVIPLEHLQSVIFCGQFIHAILFCSLLLRLLSFDFSLRIFLAQAGQYLDAPEPGTYSTPHTVQFLAGIAAHRFVGMICNSSTKPMNL